MIYLDNNATTRIDDTVLETMLPYLKEEYGNAASIQHKLGRNAHQAIEKARNNIARHLQVQAKEIFFTSGSTESISTVLKGIYERYNSIGNHIITCQTEHKAVLSTCEALSKKGANITYLAVDDQGNINLEELRNHITKDTILICLMAANNETGIIHPIAEIATICQEKGILFFCDGTQYIGKENINLSATPIDIFCFSAHKFHGPKGIGAIYIRRKTKPIQIAPLIIGGKQENSFRAGTHNVPNIVGIGTAIEVLSNADKEQIAELRNYFEKRIETEIDECIVLAKKANRIANTSNILFKYVPNSQLIAKLPNIALSSGSACVSGDRNPSHVLKAMHLSDNDALSCIRFSLSKYTKKIELDTVIDELKKTIHKIRMESPIWQMYKSGLLH